MRDTEKPNETQSDEFDNWYPDWSE